MKKICILFIAATILTNIGCFEPAEKAVGQSPVLERCSIWNEGQDTVGHPGTYFYGDAPKGYGRSATFTLTNWGAKTDTFTINAQLMDNFNKEFWQPGDKSITLSVNKITLKPGQSKEVEVVKMVTADHSSNAYFHININSQLGISEVLVFDIFQYDSDDEANDNPSQDYSGNFKTFKGMKSNKTMLGKTIRNNGKIFSVYGKSRLCCFDQKTDKLLWDVETENTILEMTVKDDMVFTNWGGYDIKTGKCIRSGYNLKFIFNDKVFIGYKTRNPQIKDEEYFGDIILVCKKYLTNDILWEIKQYRCQYPFVMPKSPDKIFFMIGAYEFGNDNLVCLDTKTGRELFKIGEHCPLEKNFKLNLLVARMQTDSYFFYDNKDHFKNDSIEVWDVGKNSRVELIKLNGLSEMTCTENNLYYADFKCCAAYSLPNRKQLWKQTGDGAILCQPVLDDAQKYLYILDEDSKWVPKDNEAVRTKKPAYARVYKFDAKTGKQIWKTVLMKVPAEIDSFLDNSFSADGWCDLKTNKDKIAIVLAGKYHLTLKAIDGKFAK